MWRRSWRETVVLGGRVAEEAVAFLSAGAAAPTEKKRMENGTMLQYFHWFTDAGGTLWQKLGTRAQQLVEDGFTAVWLPPAFKGFHPIVWAACLLLVLEAKLLSSSLLLLLWLPLLLSVFLSSSSW